jgi:gamma-glutamyltranspeptidase / glutathione hydrolase
MDRRTHRHRHAAALCAVAVLVLAGCAPDTAEQPEEEAAAPEAAPEPVPEDDPEPPPDPPEEEPPAEEEPSPLLGAHGVSAGDGDAVAAGMSILDAGGNAIDAAVAAAFAVGVVEPFASGIGGGGAAIVAWPGEDPVAYDYREVVAQDGRIPANNTGIPGFVAGMVELLEQHGSMEWAEVLAPAIDLAREGTATSTTIATQLRNSAHRLPTADLPHLYPGGQALGEGAQLVQEELAETLQHLADHGGDALYRGELATTLAAGVDGIDEASLDGYSVQRSTPPSGSFADYEVHGASPPLPGAGLIQMLQVAEALGVEEMSPDSADFIHAVAMAWRIADHSVATDLGDPDFVDVPLDELTDRDRNATLAEEVPMDRLLATGTGDGPRGTLAMGRPGSDAGNTTHLTVVDADGAMVSMTNTLTNFWGSGQYELGFFLNDQLRRFSIGTGEANVAEPGRRSVSWSLPALVTDDEGRPVLGIGSPGGRRIPMILTQTLVRWGLHGQTLAEAVEAPRFHLEGAELHVEQLPPGEVIDDLRGRGYSSVSVPDPPLYFGSVQALEVDHDSGEVVGARDTRREADFATGAAAP